MNVLPPAAFRVLNNYFHLDFDRKQKLHKSLAEASSISLWGQCTSAPFSHQYILARWEAILWLPRGASGLRRAVPAAGFLPVPSFDRHLSIHKGHSCGGTSQGQQQAVPYFSSTPSGRSMCSPWVTSIPLQLRQLLTGFLPLLSLPLPTPPPLRCSLLLAAENLRLQRSQALACFPPRPPGVAGVPLLLLPAANSPSGSWAALSRRLGRRRRR